MMGPESGGKKGGGGFGDRDTGLVMEKREQELRVLFSNHRCRAEKRKEK